ncbi:uncharacterized protein LOC124162347 [Ischnura elegans]|uniref:uncharacterized protein LOC124162347 n=1 Tax=Ischnura elegans TaxID=197161 RepID=UPI001ED8AFA4|nr:uncharacterized protein LOC124162347 [Ischnura elegans]
MNPRHLPLFLACFLSCVPLYPSSPNPSSQDSVPALPETGTDQRPNGALKSPLDAKEDEEEVSEVEGGQVELLRSARDSGSAGFPLDLPPGAAMEASHLRHRKWRLHTRWRKMSRRGLVVGDEDGGGERASEADWIPTRTLGAQRWTGAFFPDVPSGRAAEPPPPPLPDTPKNTTGSSGGNTTSASLEDISISSTTTTTTTTNPPSPHRVTMGFGMGIPAPEEDGKEEAVGDGPVVGDARELGVEDMMWDGVLGAEEDLDAEGGRRRPGLLHSAVEGDEAVDEDGVEADGEEEGAGGGVQGWKAGKDDIVSRFLRIVESQQQHALGGNCTAGTELSLGDGVVDRYAQERFRVEAEVAVNRANMLTRLWKYTPNSLLASEYILHASLFSMVEFDEDIFAAGNCYDAYQYGNNHLYCPYAYRLPEGPILVKDLAVEYKYLTNSSEWFFLARQNANRVIKNFSQFSRGFNTYTYNETTHTEREPDEILSVVYEDGKWSRPYYDCGGGNIWMLTYTVPFFGYANGSYFFKGTSGIDIDLRRVDIDQCPLPPTSTQLNIFAASDKCKKRTTECMAIPGLGFRRGSYKCVCREGFYFPDTDSESRYYNGTHVELEYERLIMGEESTYAEPGSFECWPCAEGCERCVDGSPCIAALNWVLRSAVLCLSLATLILLLPPLVLFTWKYAHVKVVRAASPVLLRVITLGAFFVYCTMVVMYPPPSVATCTARVWLREIGFSLTYGALMLKTWRISVIFRVRSAKAVKITDADLLKRLGGAVAVVGVFLGIRTLVAPPEVIVGKTADDLKAYLCSTDWWDHSFTSLEVCFLVWGIRLCIVVRKAPSEFNESRFISMAIYNEFLLSLFLNISMIFLQSPANPDLLYMIFFCHTQLTITMLLCLIFGSKAYMVFKGRGKWCSSSSSEEGATGGGGGGVGGGGGGGSMGAARAHPTAKFLSKPSSSSYCRSEQSVAHPGGLPASASALQPLAPALNNSSKGLVPPTLRDGAASPLLLAATADPQEEWDVIVQQIHSLASKLTVTKDDKPTPDPLLSTKLALVLEAVGGGGGVDGPAAAPGQEQEEEGGEEGRKKATKGGKKAEEPATTAEETGKAKTKKQEQAALNGVAEAEEEEGGGSRGGSAKKKMRWRRKKKEVDEAATPPHRAPWSGGGDEWPGGEVRKRRRRGGAARTAAAEEAADGEAARSGDGASSGGGGDGSEEAAAAGGGGSGGRGSGRRQGNDLRSGHARTHAIVIDLDDKNRFTEEVTV